MKQFAVLGLGSFGRIVAQTLAEYGAPVIGIDRNRDNVESMRDIITQAVEADVSDRNELMSLGLEGVDVAIISLGDNIEGSVLATMFLNELKIPQIIVKAVSPEHGKILKMLGATQVLFPEQDMAQRIAMTLVSPTILDHIPLVPGYSIVEYIAPRHFWGKTLLELNVRREYGVEIIAIKSQETGNIRVIPSALDKIEKGDRLIIVGKDEDIKKLREEE
jgi:trk system potassium uptake protein TrkA